MTHPEIESEQAYVDRAYARLDELRADAAGAAARAAASTGGSKQGFVERDATFAAGRRRVAHLTIGDEPVVLGRIDFRNGERLYIGRVGITDADHLPIVVDWRAPAAEPFYRGTPLEPMGVVRRRHFLCRGRTIFAIDDELLDAEAAGDLVLVGEAALLRTVARARTGRMGDIVATIQAEQDEVIRSPIDGALLVSGGPGTGKTAVGLHRAAYLLYTHRPMLERHGSLIVGPNEVFLRYIEHVLPSLGEHAVTLATSGDLVDGIDGHAREPREAALAKGHVRMVDVIREAVHDHQRGLRDEVRVLYDGELFKLTPEPSARIVDDVRAEPGTHNARRALMVRRVLAELYDRYVEAASESLAAGRRGPTRASRVDVYSAMLDDRRVLAAIDEMWPELTAERIVRERSPDPDARLTPADVALVDEAEVLVGPATPARMPVTDIDEEERWAIEQMLDEVSVADPITRAIINDSRQVFIERYLGARRELEDVGEPREPRRRFGHVVVDEAQDVSAMQWRMIARRSVTGSYTILGDLAQSMDPDASWSDLEARIGREPRSVELTINYRTPAEVMEFAERLLPQGVRPPRSVRRIGSPPDVHRADDLAPAVTRIARREREDLTDGTIGVIAPDELLGDLHDALAPETDDVLQAPVAVLGIEDAKGLEFDVVIVVEPARIIETHGTGSLYVALTRPTQRLVVVHERPLPDALSTPGSSGPRIARSRSRRRPDSAPS